MKKSVKKTVKHDRLSVIAKYLDGTSFTATIGRSGVRLSGGGEVTQDDLRRIGNWFNFVGAEKNGDRINRLEVECNRVNSVKEIAK